MRTIPLLGRKADGRAALVDDPDFDLVMQHSWYCWERIRNNRVHGPQAIAPIMIDGQRTTIKMHRLIVSQYASWARIDHENHNGLDNQRRNLRDGSAGKNERNRIVEGRGSSRYKGVYWHKASGKWQAYITCDGKRQHLGLHLTEEDAARAYDETALMLFGEYALLNFPLMVQ